MPTSDETFQACYLVRGEKAELEVTNLISQDNWQIAIAGVLAVAMGAPCETGLLWERIRARSFIAPQVAAATPEIIEGQRIAARWLQRFKLWTLARERNTHPALTLGERGEPATTTRPLG